MDGYLVSIAVRIGSASWPEGQLRLT
jgi:hypothetical protein